VRIRGTEEEEEEGRMKKRRRRRSFSSSLQEQRAVSDFVNLNFSSHFYDDLNPLRVTG